MAPMASSRIPTALHRRPPAPWQDPEASHKPWRHVKNLPRDAMQAFSGQACQQRRSPQ